jgi:hypothetical protein
LAPVPSQRAVTFNIFFEQVETVAVDWQNSSPPVLLFLGLALSYLATTFGTKDMSYPKPCPTLVA